MRRVLLVDDNIDSSEVMGELLGVMGHEVFLANDADRALALALSTAVAPSTDDTPTAVSSVSAVESRGRDFAGAPTQVRRLQILNDDLSPWADSGVVLEYALGVWPRRGQGCVIEAGGETRVRIYETGDTQTVTVRGAAPSDKPEVLPRQTIDRLSAVTARIEQQ